MDTPLKRLVRTALTGSPEPRQASQSDEDEGGPLDLSPFPQPGGGGASALTGGSVGTTQLADQAVTNAKVNNAAAIAYSKLNLAGGIVNADVAAGAAIAKSKLAALAIADADVAAGAAIALSKLATLPLTTQIAASAHPQVGVALGQGINASSTRYTNPFGGRLVCDSTEVNNEGRVLKAITVTKIRVYFSAYDRAAGTFTLRKNGAGTAISGVVDAAGVEEATGTVAFAAGDRIAIEVVTGAGGAASTLDATEVEFA